MAVSTKIIAEQMDLVWKGIKPAKSALRDILIESLSNQEKQALDFVEFMSANDSEAYTSQVAAQLETTETNAGNIMLRLVEYGIIQRKLPDKGKGYIYFVDVVIG